MSVWLMLVRAWIRLQVGFGVALCDEAARAFHGPEEDDR